MSEWIGLGAAIQRLADAGHAVDGDGMPASAFVARVAQWRAMFAREPGRRWALYEDNPAEFAAALFGAWHAGKAVWLPGDTCAGTLAALHGEVDGVAGSLPHGIRPQPEDAEADQWEPLSPEHTQVTLFTSGSTGAPTGVPKRLSQLEAEVCALEAAFGSRVARDARVLATVSHQHIYGLLFCVLWPLAAGRTMASGRLGFLEEMTALGPVGNAVLVSSPAHLRRIPDGIDLSVSRIALQAVFSSGGPLPPDAAANVLRQWGESPVEVYGSSETGGIAWRQAAYHGERWTALPGVAWRLEEGFLAVQSPHLAEAGWYRCADRAVEDGEAGFTLAGRADRIVKIEEKRVSLSLVERQLMGSALVQEARVLAMDLDIGKRLAAVVVPSTQGRALLAQSGRKALVASLRDVLGEAVEAIALPRRWSFPDALPCNAQGKVTEALLCEQFRRILPQVVWTSRGELQARADLLINEDLAVFDGHFDGTPIVPGVAQVEWAFALAAQVLPVPPRERFCRLDTLKFQQVIRPGEHVQLELDWQPGRSMLAFRLASASGPHASGRIVFQGEASDAAK